MSGSAELTVEALSRTISNLQKLSSENETNPKFPTATRGISNLQLRVVSGSAERLDYLRPGGSDPKGARRSLTVEALSRTISVLAHLQLAFSPKFEVRNSKSFD